MIRFKEYIIEVFDKPAKTIYSKKPDINYSGATKHKWVFEVNNKKYFIDIHESSEHPNTHKSYEVGFGIVHDASWKRYKDTGFGTDQYKVLSTVINTSIDFFKEKKLKSGDIIEFMIYENASDIKMNLYKRYGQELAKRFGMNLKIYLTNFILTKK